MSFITVKGSSITVHDPKLLTWVRSIAGSPEESERVAATAVNAMPIISMTTHTVIVVVLFIIASPHSSADGVFL